MLNWQIYFRATPICSLSEDLSIDFDTRFTTGYLFLWVFILISFFVLLGFTKGLSLFKVLREQSLAIKLATPEIYNCQTLYAPFRKQPLPRAVKMCGEKLRRLRQRPRKKLRKLKNWKPRRQSCHCKMDAMESGKRKRGNCLIRIQSKGSHIIFKCTLTHTHHSLHSRSLSLANNNRGSSTCRLLSISLGFSIPVQLQRAAACVSF